MAATLKTTVIQEPSSGTVNMTLGSTGGVTFGSSITSNTITSAASTALNIQSAGFTAMTIDTSQNVGIGTSSPSFNLHTYASSGAVQSMVQTGASASANMNLRNSDRYWTLTNQSGGALLVYDTTAGASRMAFDTSGNVGIGTTNPTNLLAVIGTSGSLTQSIRVNSSGGTTSVRSGLWLSGNQSTSHYNWLLASQYNVNGAFEITPSTATDGATFSTPAVVVTYSGNVGIGTISPGYKLDVASGDTVAGQAIRIRANSTAAKGGLQFTDSAASSQYGWIKGASTGLSFYGGGNASGDVFIDSSGNLLVGTTTSTARLTVQGGSSAEGTALFNLSSSLSYNFTWYVAAGTGANAAATAQIVPKNSSTSRSINAAGTINASGADYAEYMTKSGDFTVAKGDVVGINSQGKLTNVFNDAISFVVKSTDPSYVGGDVWGTEEIIGYKRPTNNSTEDEKAAFESALEKARQLVDRIAFAGQVPVNVTGATAGQYIIPVNDNGAIKGQAVSNPTFEQYQISVGKVVAIESDGRARIIVKVA